MGSIVSLLADRMHLPPAEEWTTKTTALVVKRALEQRTRYARLYAVEIRWVPFELRNPADYYAQCPPLHTRMQFLNLSWCSNNMLLELERRGWIRGNYPTLFLFTDKESMLGCLYAHELVWSLAWSALQWVLWMESLMLKEFPDEIMKRISRQIHRAANLLKKQSCDAMTTVLNEYSMEQVINRMVYSAIEMLDLREKMSGWVSPLAQIYDVMFIHMGTFDPVAVDDVEAMVYVMKQARSILMRRVSSQEQ